MQFIVAFLWGSLAAILPSLIGRILLALGIGYVTYTGFNFLVDSLYAQIQSNIGAMPVAIASFLGYLWVDKAIALVFSAYTAAIAIKLAGSTVLKKMVMK